MGGIGMRKLYLAAAAIAIFSLLASPALGAAPKPSGTLSMTSQGARLAAGSGPAYGKASGFDASFDGVKRQDDVRGQVVGRPRGSVVYGRVSDGSGSPRSVGRARRQRSDHASVGW